MSESTWLCRVLYDGTTDGTTVLELMICIDNFDDEMILSTDLYEKRIETCDAMNGTFHD